MKKIKSSPAVIIYQIFNYLLLGVLTLICIYPFWYMLIYTLSDPSIADVKTPILLPTHVTLFNYQQIFQINGFFHALLISVLRTAIGTTVTVFSCSFLGFLFTKHEMPARTFLYRALVLTMYISGGMIPTFLLIRSYGLLNNFLVYILPVMVPAYNIILIKTFIEQLPPSLEESAVIDGAGYFTVFWRLIFPLSTPIIATVAVFVAVGQWNAWFDNYIYAGNNENLKTLQYLLYNYLNQAQQMANQIQNSIAGGGAINGAAMSISPKGVRMTITVLVSLPIFVVYPFMQRFFVKGIMLGAVKG